MIEYPKALYRDGAGAQFEQLPCVTVNSREEECAKNLEGWFEIGKAPSSAEPDGANDELAELRHTLAEKGVTVDKRWGEKRLREELAKVS